LAMRIIIISSYFDFGVSGVFKRRLG